MLPTVVLFGEILADIFPEQSVLGGAPFNVAWHLQMLGVQPILISRIGKDALAEQVLQAMRQHGLETRGVQYANRHPTGQVRIHMEGNKHYFDILPLQAYDFIHPSFVRMTAISMSVDWVYFGTLAQRHNVSRYALNTLLHSTQAPRMLDINLRHPWYDRELCRRALNQANILKLNLEELHELSDMFGCDDPRLMSQVQNLMTHFKLEQVVVTCGEEGARHFNCDGSHATSSIRYTPLQMVDTVGAGDAFAAIYILGTLKRWPAEQILTRANEFAAAVCGIRGAIPDHGEFYQPFIRGWQI